MLQRILIVCVGNICRSPTAEYLLRKALAGGTQVQSAGLGALVGHPMDATALDVLAAHDVDASEHRARQLTPSLLREADLVFGMEQVHVADIISMSSEGSGKVYLLDHWGKRQDVPDPYRKRRETFEHVYDMIAHSVDDWLRHL